MSIKPRVPILWLLALLIVFSLAQQRVAIGLSTAIAQPLQDGVELGPKDGKDLPPADIDRVKVGAEAPNFSLEDQDGRVVTLSSFRGKKAVVLVFYRGKWWPYCATQLGKLKNLLDENRKKNVQLIAVSPDTREASKALIEKLKASDASFDFLFLEDKNHKVIDRYGLLNTGSKLAIPHPTTYVIDKRGVVVWKFTEVDYRVRPTNEMIIDALKKNGL